MTLTDIYGAKALAQIIAQLLECGFVGLFFDALDILLIANRGYMILAPLASAKTPFHAVFAHNRYLAPKVRVFVDFLAERMEQL